MTTQEMHIGIDLYLQKVNSDYVDSLRPEEKDWFLNDEQKRFVFNRINSSSNDKRQGLQYNQKRFDDIRDLITPYSSVALIKDDNSNYIELPPNYLYLLNDRSKVDTICNRTVDITPVKTYYYKNVFNLSRFTAVEEVNMLTITIDGDIVFDMADFDLTISDLSELFLVYNLILTTLRNLGYTVYWETFENQYYSNSFIMIDSREFNITLEGKEIKEDSKVEEIIGFHRISTSKKEIPNRLTKTEDLYELLRGSFTKTSKESPISTLEGNQLIVFHNGYFILADILISYIRIPRMVSLSLGINSELNPNIHEELVTQTAKRIAAYIETRNYGQVSNEDRIKE